VNLSAILTSFLSIRRLPTPHAMFDKARFHK